MHFDLVYSRVYKGGGELWEKLRVKKPPQISYPFDNVLLSMMKKRAINSLRNENKNVYDIYIYIYIVTIREKNNATFSRIVPVVTGVVGTSKRVRDIKKKKDVMIRVTKNKKNAIIFVLTRDI